MKGMEEIWQYMCCAQLVKIRMSLLNMGIGVVSYGKMVKIEVRLGCEGPVAVVKDKLETQNTMDHRGGEVQVEGLALMDRGNGEEQARLRSMDYESQVKLRSRSYHYMKVKSSEDNC